MFLFAAVQGEYVGFINKLTILNTSFCTSAKAKKKQKKNTVQVDKDWKNRVGLRHILSKRGILKVVQKICIHVETIWHFFVVCLLS